MPLFKQKRQVDIRMRKSGGVLLGILGGGVPPGSPNPDPISDKKMPFPIRFQTRP